MRTLALIIIFLPLLAYSQNIADFENISLAPDSYLKDSGELGYFESGDVILPNEYTDAGSFDFWNGWVISNIQDSISPGFINEAASIAGSGYQGSSNYAVSYAPNPVIIRLSDQSRGSNVPGLQISNSTYAALSMLNGDSFAKRFGGEDGTDPDYFYVSFKKWHDGTLSQDSVNHYLADYRFEDGQMDYISREWSWVDLNSLGPVDSLQCQIFSSDTGAFGINTPSYFCIDNVHVERTSSASDSRRPLATSFDIFPNPASISICSSYIQNNKFLIYDSSGRIVNQGFSDNECIDIASLPKGNYYLRTGSRTAQFIKI